MRNKPTPIKKTETHEEFAKRNGIKEFWNGGKPQEEAVFVTKGFASKGLNEA